VPVFPEGISPASMGNRPENGKLTGTISPSQIHGKGKKLLVEGWPVRLFTGGIADSSGSVIPEGHCHVFIGCLTKGIVGGHRVNHNREIPLFIC